jgi:general stress protein 26
MDKNVSFLSKREDGMSKEELKRELDFAKVREQKVKFLEGHRVIVLATSRYNRVTARTVTYTTRGSNIYFMSWDHHKKVVQMRENPKVALCRDNVNIEGVAEILGTPLDEKNKECAEIYKKKLPRDFAGFAAKPGMVMVRVTSTFIVSMVRINDRLYLEHLDLRNKVAYLKALEE